MHRRHFMARSASLAAAAPLAQASAATAPTASSAASAAASSAASSAASALFERYWEALMRQYPEWATYVGDHRHGDRLRDASPAGIAGEFELVRRYRAEAQALAGTALPARERQSLDILLHRLDDELALEPFEGYRSMTLGARSGLHSDFADLLQVCPVDTEAQVQQLLARMAAFPRRMAQEIVLLRRARALRWVPARPVLQRVQQQIDELLKLPPAESPYLEPFRRLPAAWPQSRREALATQGEAAFRSHIVPAVQQLRALVVDELVPAAADEGALAGYPDGEAVYAQLVRSHTTTTLAPREIHAIGQRELDRIRAEMDAVRSEMKFSGDFAAFVRHLYTDPKYFHAGPRELLVGYRDICKRIDGELPRLFTHLPRAPYGVRAMPDHYGEDFAEYYEGPDLDITRAGWFNANTLGYRKRPTWGMETTTAHEAVPGHHLQIAHAQEQGELPRFRRGGGFTVYSEGWAVYAETLGFELGLYKDPESRFGHLQWQAFRAARLVVDTGLHVLGWSRQRAIDFMIERTGETPDVVASEVDRYISWPGQALSYMVGKLRIDALRDAAKTAMGARFDIRQFHRVVLDQGSVPLPLLEAAVRQWMTGVR